MRILLALATLFALVAFVAPASAQFRHQPGVVMMDIPVPCAYSPGCRRHRAAPLRYYQPRSSTRYYYYSRGHYPSNRYCHWVAPGMTRCVTVSRRYY